MSQRSRKARAKQRARAGRTGRRQPPPRRGGANRLPLFGGLAIAVAALGALVVLVAGGGDDAPEAPEGVEVFEALPNDHVTGTVEYEQNPPAGGPHHPPPNWQNCGFYAEPVPNEQAVHSLEHGAVWITYRPDLPDEQVEAIRDLVRRRVNLGEGGWVLASPYPDLPAPVVASAWERQLRLDSADDPRLEEFVDVFEKGAQSPEPGAACMGGIGTPE